MLINDDELTIRSAKESDAACLTHWWNDGRVMAHAGFPHGLGQSVETTLQQIDRNSHELSQLCIIEVNGVPAGEMNFRIQGSEAEIGIKICEEAYQNQGYGTRFLQLLIDYLFHDELFNQKVRIEKIVLDTNLNNVRAQHVYEKLGFVKTAVHHDSWQNQEGEWQSSIEYEKPR